MYWTKLATYPCVFEEHHFISEHPVFENAQSIRGMTTEYMAILGSIAIAWLTVAYRAINAALANPVISLRSE